MHTRYGKQLKQLLLDNYDIVFIAETNAEPSFSDARVRQSPPVARKHAPNTQPPADHDVCFASSAGRCSSCSDRRPRLTAAQRVEGCVDMQQREARMSCACARSKQTDLDADADWSPPLRAPDIYERFISLPRHSVCSERPPPQRPVHATVGAEIRLDMVVVRDVSEAAAISSWRTGSDP